MTLSTWLFYVAAVFVLTVTPGPSVLMCVSTSIRYGPGRAMVAAAGSTTAIAILMVLSMLGLSSVLAASEPMFATLKWLGVAYLGYLGITAIRSKVTQLDVPLASIVPGTGGFFVRGLLIGASNPKALLFFGALFPQFIDSAAPQLPQFLILGATFVGFEITWLAVYALTAAKARAWLQKPRRATMFNRLTGVVFLTAAGLLATVRRNPT